MAVERQGGAHMCRDDHVQIWHNDGEYEQCPLCRANYQTERLRDALERIALLDEADGHELKEKHAFQAVAIATQAIGKHPSEICAERQRS
jgi:hypothetical protein